MTRSAVLTAVGVSVAIAFLSGGSAVGQTPREQMNARYATLIEKRLAGPQPMQVSAATITLNGDELHLVHQATFQFDGTVIQAEEAVVHRDTKRVELRGKISGSLSADAARQLGLAAPRVEYR